MANVDTILKDLEAKVRSILLPLQSANPATPNHRVYRGNPMPEQLNTDLPKKIVHVALVVSPSGEQRVPGKTSGTQQVSDPDVQLVATVTGGKTFVGSPISVQFSGTVVPGTRLMVQIGTNYVPYTLPTGATPDAVATLVAAAVNANADAAALVTSAAVGDTVTFTNNAPITTGNSFPFDLRIGGTADFVSSVRYGKAEFHIHIFGYDDDSRALYGNTLDDVLSDIRMLSLSDGTAGNLEYVRMLQTDKELSHLAYRRTLVYSVQYNRTALTTGYQVLAGLVHFIGGN